MKRTKGQKDFLKSRGLDENSPGEEVQEAKSEYWRKYKREYLAEIRRNNRRVEVTLTKSQYSRLSKEAERHSMKTSTFAKESIFAHLDRHFILPTDSRVAKLELGIVKIGTNINQLVRHTHEKKAIDELDITRINALLVKLEDTISEALRNPPEAE